MEHQAEIEPTYSIISIKAKNLSNDYRAMVFSKWLRSLRFGNPIFKKIEPKAYYKNYHKFIENMLAKPDATIRMAVLTDNHDCVLGFSAHREDVLDYMHVHKDYRLQGIGRLLVPSGTTTFTHITKTWFPFWQKLDKDWRFNPFA